MSEPVITCPNCHSEIKLTESLAAPLIEAARKDYEERFAEKDAAVAKRETAVRDQLAQIAKERQSIETEVTARLDAERKRIAGEENEKARRLVETDLRQKDQQLSELGQVLQQREEKLAEAQKAQADLIRRNVSLTTPDGRSNSPWKSRSRHPCRPCARRPSGKRKSHSY